MSIPGNVICCQPAGNALSRSHTLVLPCTDRDSTKRGNVIPIHGAVCHPSLPPPLPESGQLGRHSWRRLYGVGSSLDRISPETNEGKYTAAAEWRGQTDLQTI